jgi:hypothetical protein
MDVCRGQDAPILTQAIDYFILIVFFLVPLILVISRVVRDDPVHRAGFHGGSHENQSTVTRPCMKSAAPPFPVSRPCQKRCELLKVAAT